jgi:hypothetical protein
MRCDAVGFQEACLWAWAIRNGIDPANFRGRLGSDAFIGSPTRLLQRSDRLGSASRKHCSRGIEALKKLIRRAKSDPKI